jgi:hypothetical protein
VQVAVAVVPLSIPTHGKKNTGVRTQLEDNELEEYVKFVVEERERIMERTDSGDK